MGFHKKLVKPHIWKRVFYERLTEPLHLNLVSIPVALFGSFRLKVDFDLIVRQYNAYSLLAAADLAKRQGLSRISVVEFGVAAGAGLVNKGLIAKKVTASTGVEIAIYGFDTGQGMPPARDYRDHPELYQEGDFVGDYDRLRSILPSNCHLVLGDIESTVPRFLQEQVNPSCPIGYVDVDVDYYSSTVDALRLLQGPPELYLPITLVYLDDVHFEAHNPYAGELLAVNEFNRSQPMRKICRPEFLENRRIFHRAEWIKHIYYLQVMDHPIRSSVSKRAPQRLDNPYLD